jgi:hypothetical protein
MDGPAMTTNSAKITFYVEPRTIGERFLTAATLAHAVGSEAGGT